MGVWRTINGKPVFIEKASDGVDKRKTIDYNDFSGTKDYDYYKQNAELKLPAKEYGYVAHEINSNCKKWTIGMNQQVWFFQNNYYRYTFHYESFDKFVILNKEVD